MFVDKIISAEWRVLNCSEKGEIRRVVNAHDDAEYTESDIDNFVELLFRKVAEELGVKYNTIKDVLYGRNAEFLEKKARLFEQEGDCIYEDEKNSLLSEISIPNVNYLGTKTMAERFMEDFIELPIQDKVEVLESLSKMRVKISNVEDSTTSSILLGQFSELREHEKYAVLKQIFKAEVVDHFAEDTVADIPIIKRM